MNSDPIKKTIESIVNVFETGKPDGDYSNVTLVANDMGHLTYGRSQTTLASGNLYLLISRYTADPSAKYGFILGKFLNKLERMDVSLDQDDTFINTLRLAGSDPVMMQVQDTFFDEAFYDPARKEWQRMNMVEPLSLAVIYDSFIHGSYKKIKDRTIKALSSSKYNEHEWISTYVKLRWRWLDSLSQLRGTTYRMMTFMTLISNNNWKLQNVVIRGFHLNASVDTQPVVDLDYEQVNGSSPRVSAGSSKLYRLESPPVHNDEILRIQNALNAAGLVSPTNGSYDNLTYIAIRAFQALHGITVDGVIGPITKSYLNI